MRIGHVVDSLAVGGAERVTLDACNLLISSGHEVVLILIRSGGTLAQNLDPKVELIQLKFESKLNLLGWRRLVKAISGFDLVHVHMRHTYGRVKIAGFLNLSSCPILFHDHYGDIRHDRSVPIWLKGILKPKWYIGVSRELSSWAKDVLKVKPTNIFTLPNTIARNPVIQRMSPENRIVLVSNIRKTKNIEFAILLAQNMEIGLDIIGQIIDIDYFHDLEKQASLADVRFLTGVSDILPLLGTYKMAIHTAVSETGPLVLMEYLMCGLPFICFKTGEVVETIQNDLPRSIMPDMDSGTWKQGIEGMMENPYSAEILSEVFHKYFSPAQYLSKLERIYECVTG